MEMVFTNKKGGGRYYIKDYELVIFKFGLEGKTGKEPIKYESWSSFRR